MSKTEIRTRGGIAGFVDAARRIVAFSRGTGAAPPAPAPRKRPRGKSGVDAKQRKIADVRRLAGQGIDRREIARRTGLSHDTVSMLLNLSHANAAESAAPGTFFRALQWRATV